MRRWPWSSPPWDEVTYLAVDLETSGLDPRRDAILAVGAVPVRGGVVRLAEAWQTLVRPPPGAPLAEGAVRAHQLVPADLRQAPPLPEVMGELDRRLHGAALLVHQAAVEVPFLRRAHAACGARWPAPPVVDTVPLLLRAARRARLLDPAAPPVEGALRLAEARRRHGLPDYGAHDALADAVGTAELFLALRWALGARRLRQLRARAPRR